jgi:hydroxypyruvate reductase
MLTATLQLHPHGRAVSRILSAALAAVEPGEVVCRAVTRKGDHLLVAGQEYDLASFRRVILLGIGKAAFGMAEALANLLGDQLSEGLVITKHVPEGLLPTLTVLEGGHPLPDERSRDAGERIFALVSSLDKSDLLFCLISGGGSSLACAPLPDLSIVDLQDVTRDLLSSGARVDEINTLRRHLDRIKGGGLARLANGATVISLILSDVVGNPLEAIASGPTAPDPTTRVEARSVLQRYSLDTRLDTRILSALENAPETQKPGEALFDHVQNTLVGSNLLAAQSALKQAEQEGFHPYLWRTDLQGEARQAAFELATFLRQARQTGLPVPPPGCIVVGGETTVTVRGAGRGGRNTELALASVTELAGYPGVLLASLATDGEDGTTDAAGAVVTGGTYRRAADLGLDPQAYLERNDSYAFFDRLGDLIKPGPTGTNVNDLTFLFSV